MLKIGELPGSWKSKHDRIPPEIARSLYAKVCELARKDPSPVNIARQLSASHSLSLSPGTVRHWMMGDRHPSLNTVQMNIFAPRPSRPLSYIIGANIGDGCTLTKNWIVKLAVSDLDFAQAFNLNMATLFSRDTPNKILIQRFKVKRLPLYVVRYGSKQLVNLLRLPLKKLLEFAFAFPREFLRGFFDAEGHVDVGAGDQFHLAVGAENSDKSLLSRARQLFKSLGISSRIEMKRKAGSLKTIRGVTFAMRRTSYALTISRIDDIKLFAEDVGFSILRKRRKLLDATMIIDTVAPVSRSKAWTQLYTKERGEWIRRVSY